MTTQQNGSNQQQVHEVLERVRGLSNVEMIGGVPEPASLIDFIHTDVNGVDSQEAFSIMQRRGKVFMNNRSQAVRLPKELQFSTDEVFIRREGEDVILSPRPRDWRPYLDTGSVASDAFMENVQDLPVQEREP